MEVDNYRMNNFIHPIDVLVTRYPQLSMPIMRGISKSKEYADVCLRGALSDRKPEFIKSQDDRLETVDTIAGCVDVLYLANREDFEHAYRALGYRCEPEDIPITIGAVTLLGLNNWEKVRQIGGIKAATDKKLYKDTMILLSKGVYSGVSAEIVGMPEQEWIEKSYIIRKYHEITHYISRNIYPNNKNAIRDEVMADMIGLLFAFSQYDTHLAKVFLGIENDTYRVGGRLENYVANGQDISDVCMYANRCVEVFKDNLVNLDLTNPFEILNLYEKEKIGLE